MKFVRVRGTHRLLNGSPMLFSVTSEVGWGEIVSWLSEGERQGVPSRSSESSSLSSSVGRESNLGLDIMEEGGEREGGERETEGEGGRERWREEGERERERVSEEVRGREREREKGEREIERKGERGRREGGERGR